MSRTQSVSVLRHRISELELENHKLVETVTLLRSQLAECQEQLRQVKEEIARLENLDERHWREDCRALARVWSILVEHGWPREQCQSIWLVAEDLLNNQEAENTRLIGALEKSYEIAKEAYFGHTCRQCSSDAGGVYYSLKEALESARKVTSE